MRRVQVLIGTCFTVSFRVTVCLGLRIGLGIGLGSELGELCLGEMGLGEMGQNPYVIARLLHSAVNTL